MSSTLRFKEKILAGPEVVSYEPITNFQAENCGQRSPVTTPSLIDMLNFRLTFGNPEVAEARVVRMSSRSRETMKRLSRKRRLTNKETVFRPTRGSDIWHNITSISSIGLKSGFWGRRAFSGVPSAFSPSDLEIEHYLGFDLAWLGMALARHFGIPIAASRLVDFTESYARSDKGHRCTQYIGVQRCTSVMVNGMSVIFMTSSQRLTMDAVLTQLGHLHRQSAATLSADGRVIVQAHGAKRVHTCAVSETFLYIGLLNWWYRVSQVVSLADPGCPFSWTDSEGFQGGSVTTLSLTCKLIMLATDASSLSPTTAISSLLQRSFYSLQDPMKSTLKTTLSQVVLPQVLGLHPRFQIIDKASNAKCLTKLEFWFLKPSSFSSPQVPQFFEFLFKSLQAVLGILCLE
ncbi:hypothetical protein C8R45DRAFT_1183469 [Mycena sanguinolenta]|nr:hypothetical protein C8R45DRAFT_1183469 [Mycena sanguinolenta]